MNERNMGASYEGDSDNENNDITNIKVELDDLCNQLENEFIADLKSQLNRIESDSRINRILDLIENYRPNITSIKEIFNRVVQ